MSPWGESLSVAESPYVSCNRQSVLESVNNDQERALDVLLGMSDPEYVSTQPVQEVRIDSQRRPILCL